MKKLILTSSFLLLTSYFAPAAAAQPEAPFQVATRGMAVKGIDKSVASASESSDAPPRWSQDSIVVSTFPKP